MDALPGGNEVLGAFTTARRGVFSGAGGGIGALAYVVGYTSSHCFVGTAVYDRSFLC